MEGGLTGDEQPRRASLTPYGDIFDEVLPQFMSMGMTYDEFWDCAYGVKTAWQKAFQIRMEREQKLTDINNWYMGQYIFKALQAVPLLVAGLNVKRTDNIPKYPDKPLLQEAEERKKEEIRRKKEEDQQKLAMALFQAGIAKFNKRFAKEQQKPKAVRTGQ